MRHLYPHITAPLLRSVLAQQICVLLKTKHALHGKNTEANERISAQHRTAVHWTARAIAAVQDALDDELIELPAPQPVETQT